jgi:hypothetical protein
VAAEESKPIDDHRASAHMEKNGIGFSESLETVGGG